MHLLDLLVFLVEQHHRLRILVLALCRGNALSGEGNCSKVDFMNSLRTSLKTSFSVPCLCLQQRFPGRMLYEQIWDQKVRKPTTIHVHFTMNSNLGSQLSKACESVVLVMDVVGHVLQILASIIALSGQGKFKSVQTTSTFSHLHMSLNQKSFQEDKVAMLCVLYIHHPPWILNRTL